MNFHGFKINIAVTGGGSLYISDRLTEGGASEYLLEAHVPYATEALEQFVGGVREKYCSSSTARQMAMTCLRRCRDLNEPKGVGVGVTCSLSKPGGERKGRIHNIHIAMAHKQHVAEINWTDEGMESSTRDGEEALAAILIEKALEIFIGGLNRMTHGEHISFEDLFSGFSIAKLGISVKLPTSRATDRIHGLSIAGGTLFYEGFTCYSNYLNADKETPICIYPGSFNPWHAGHQEILDKSIELFGAENTFLEFSVNNFDKPGIDAIELSNRLVGLPHNTLISNAVKFLDKLRVIGRGRPVVFALGTDTLARIDMEDFNLVDLGMIKFLVFPRNGQTIKNFNFHPWLIDERSYDLEEGPTVSSTELRKGK